MLVERATQRCCYLQWEPPPASRQQTIFPAPLRRRCQARCPRIVVVRQRFHDGAHVTLEPHQSGIITSSSSDVKHVIPIGGRPLLLSQPELHRTRRGKAIPQGEEVTPRLSRHTKLFTTCEQVQSIKVLHLRTVLRHA